MRIIHASLRAVLGIMLLGLAGAVGVTSGQDLPGIQEKIAELPRLNWQQRSDWMNVKEFGAVGDGIADDTAAIQSVYDKLMARSLSRVVYFPPGVYRITETLTIGNDTSGIAIVGHGRDTVLAWDGEEGGTMYWSNGVHRSRWEGITYDGRGKAGIGSEHRSMARYETHIIYQHCAFINLEYGVAVSKNPRQAAAAEVWYNNVLFKNNGTGVLLNLFNDYDHWFTGCVFVDNGIGLHSNIGHFNIYNSHFIRSRDVDVRMGNPVHPPAIRWCTSTGSNRFYDSAHARHTQPIAFQNIRVDGWTATDGAIRLGRRGPNLIFDMIFVNPPNEEPPIRLTNSRSIEPWTEQLVVHSNNVAAASSSLIDPGAFSRITEIPGGKVPLVVTTGDEWFFQHTVDVSGRVFDAKVDFGAKGNGVSDDTVAIQQTIDAAREHGQGAVAYLPRGTYRVTDTLALHGEAYSLESTGFSSSLKWDGADDGLMIAVTDPQSLAIEHLQMDCPDTVTRIRQTGSGASSIYYNNLHLSGVYTKSPGIELFELPADAKVRMGLIGGYVRAVDSGPATILGTIHLGRLETEGAGRAKSGFLGFIYHNTAIHDYVVVVKDNQDLVIGDLYNESNDRFLLAEGGARSGPGRITIGASKISTHLPDTLTIDNYEGRIWISTGSWQCQKDTTGTPMELRHRGDRPVDLLLVGNAFNHLDPIYSFAPSLRPILIENALWAYEKARTYDNQIPDGGMEAAILALDDFRQLGLVNQMLNYQPSSK